MHKLIKAISEMNPEKLKELLPNKQYSSVSKNYFIDCLEVTFNKFRKKGYYKFENVVTGYCDSCHENNNYKGYSFLTSDNKFLDLTFHIDNNKINDIFSCGNLMISDKIEKNYKDAESLTLNISIEEDYNFKHPISSLKKRDKIVKLLNGLKKYHNKIVDLDSLVEYQQKMKIIYSEISVYEIVNYKKLFDGFLKVKNSLEELFELKYNIGISKQAMYDYKKINLKKEEDVVEWILKYYEYEPDFYEDNKRVQNFLFKLSNTEYNIIIDCDLYKDTYLFSKKYWQHSGELFEKYRPKEEDLDKVTYHEVPYYLKFHNVYEGILEKYFLQ